MFLSRKDILLIKNAINKVKIHLLLMGLLIGSVDQIQAQDPEFTQFYSNPIYLNPAFAGSRICPRFVMNYRNEWPNISGNFVTTAASYDQKVEGLLLWEELDLSVLCIHDSGDTMGRDGYVNSSNSRKPEFQRISINL